MTEDERTAKLPPLCYIRYPTTSETVEIRRGEDGWHPANTKCSPECLNAKLAHGVIHVLDVLDRAFAGSNVRLRLFGLKSQAIAHAMVHPRVASCDSQAYGMAARQDALKARVSKSDQIVARTMTRWYLHQVATLNASSRFIRAHNWPDPSRRPELIDAVDARRRRGRGIAWSS